MEASVIPAFEMSCKALFDQVDATFQKGVIEHTSTAQQQIESAHSPLAIALRVRSYNLNKLMPAGPTPISLLTCQVSLGCHKFSIILDSNIEW